MRTPRWFGVPILVSIAVALAGCGVWSTDSGSNKTITVVYSDASSAALVAWFGDMKQQFEAKHSGVTVNLQAVTGTTSDYYTKLALLNSNPGTAPDVIYEDSFMLKPDAEAGYLLPLDDRLAGWADWQQFEPSVRAAGTGSDGKVYGVSVGTDTRALWYNRDIFAQAGLPAEWKPKTWDDVLNAARTIKQKVPGVTPLNVYAGAAAGEGSVMQGFLMLNYGAQGGGLTDSGGRWRVGSQGFRSSLDLVNTVYAEGLGYGPQVTSSSNYSTIVRTQDLPTGKLAIDLDGSYIPQNWGSKGSRPWAEWQTKLGVAAMPTQDGQQPGFSSMSGGWTLAVGARTKAPDLAFDFLSTALSKDNAQRLAIDYSLIPARTDVAASPEYRASSPSAEFFASLIPGTHFRPATSDYAKISAEIQKRIEAVITRQQSPEAAARAYDNEVVAIVGEQKSVKG